MAEKEQIATYVEPEEKQRVRIAAAEEGVGMAEWVRKAVLEKLEQDEKQDEQQGNPKMLVTAD